MAFFVTIMGKFEKMISFKLNRSKIHITRNFMLIPMKKKRFSLQPLNLKVTVTVTAMVIVTLMVKVIGTLIVTVTVTTI